TSSGRRLFRSQLQRLGSACPSSIRQVPPRQQERLDGGPDQLAFRPVEKSACFTWPAGMKEMALPVMKSDIRAAGRGRGEGCAPPGDAQGLTQRRFPGSLAAHLPWGGPGAVRGSDLG